jgi:hypothetical protein
MTGFRQKLVFALTLAACATLSNAPTASAAETPRLEVDPFWPKPLPNNWILGQVSGVAVAAHAHPR